MATEGVKGPTPPEVLAAIQDVVAKARTGDAAVLPQLRAIMDRNPGLSRISGDLARHAESAWIALASGPNLYMKEALTREAESRRTELTRPGATPIEQLLVARVVACGLQLDYLSAAEANALGAGDSYRLVEHQAKRVERAQRMLLSATGALVTYQKLVPAAHVVADSANTVLRAPAQSEQTADPSPVTNTADRVPVLIEDVEPDEVRPETHERLRVGVTY
jgi:hypothetical protein